MLWRCVVFGTVLLVDWIGLDWIGLDCIGVYKSAMQDRKRKSELSIRLLCPTLHDVVTIHTNVCITRIPMPAKNGRRLCCFR
jgi:hypothetical protein